MSASTGSPAKHPVPMILGAVIVVALIGARIWGIVALATGGGSSPTGTGSGTAAAAGAPAESVLPDSTAMGAVQLRTTDLERLRAYYVDAIGLELLDSTDTELAIGTAATDDAPAREIVRLILDDGLAADSLRAAGLYHTAVLCPDAPALAEALMQGATGAPASYQGSADHAVSQAFYSGDPDGNGVELYVDRPRDAWQWTDGRVTMGSAALDPNAFIEQHLGDATAGAPLVGHVHLRVGDVEQARAFYEGVLGFAVTSEVDGAIFFGAGGYHHHLAANTWQSAGAGQRPITAGLHIVEIELGNASALADLVARAESAGVVVTLIDGGVELPDPWGTVLRISA